MGADRRYPLEELYGSRSADALLCRTENTIAIRVNFGTRSADGSPGRKEARPDVVAATDQPICCRKIPAATKAFNATSHLYLSRAHRHRTLSSPPTDFFTACTSA